LFAQLANKLIVSRRFLDQPDEDTCQTSGRRTGAWRHDCLKHLWKLLIQRLINLYSKIESSASEPRHPRFRSRVVTLPGIPNIHPCCHPAPCSGDQVAGYSNWRHRCEKERLFFIYCIFLRF